MNALANNLCIVDDDEAVRRSLGLLLLSRGYAVQTFASGEAFLEGADLQRAGCAILDLRMDGMSGLQVFDALRAQDSPLVVIFLSGHGDIPMAVEAVQNGAFGWLEKPCNDEQLLDSIARALRQAGENAVRRQARQAAQALWDKLTPREMQVARLVAEGKPNKQIALELAPLEQRTVETHRAHVFAKLGLSNSHQLDRFLREHAL
ncbi:MULTISPECIES: response regulator transcription factor [Variovorax]|jgi:FixJ family two-component response regulator|uniref:response regulator transcription factor n=1 Tax=Variovorax TaxID=34072 RepID=UPI00086E7D99|nr:MULTISPECIES: response regulator [Variovorax]MBN8753042.1 response regulator transcription factor [Variovorax sp.]ODU16709.1 MAG: DNA-binding response regulator [Variovorax sp. SCN 67-85]ODV24683.1 MAG: DNA-binding response regulator [Variovorax sp. SCN 67-20]OJZ15423.1 MAG: DNA-binding response regulator [Variovorax sp. 67-131]UKI07851.1 response regulator [Variovorax paradoxus]